MNFLNFIRKWLTPPVRWGLFIVLMPLLAAAAGLIWLDTAPGKRFIEGVAASATAQGPLRVEITGLGGALPFSPRLARLRLSDAQGVWLAADDLALDLDPLALMAGTLRLPLVSVGRLEVRRLPVDPAPAETNPEPAEPFSPDSLPLQRLTVERLAVADFSVGESVAGIALDGEVRLSDLAATVAEAAVNLEILRINNNILSANLKVDLQHLRASGAAAFNLPDLAPLAALAGQAAAGRARLDLTLQATDDGGQAATLKLRGDGLKAAGVAIGDAALDGAASYRGGGISGFDPAKGQVELAGVRLSAAGATLAADLNIDLARLRGTGDLAVNLPDLAPLAVLAGQQAAGKAAVALTLRPSDDGGQAATLKLRGDGLKAAGIDVGDAALDAVATYLDGGGDRRIELESAKLTAAGATLAAEGVMQGDGLSFAWRLNPLALKTLARFAPELAHLAGTVAAEGEVSGALSDPTAAARVRAQGVGMAESAALGVKPVNADVALRWADGAGRVEATAADGDGRLNLKAQASVRDSGKTVDAKADGAVDLALFNELLAATGDTAAGRLSFSAAAAGPVAAPRLWADAVLTGGGYRLHALGTELSNIALKAGFDGKRATLSNLTAETAGGGRLSASGRVDLGGAAPVFDFKLTARNALLADSTLATVAADADIAFAGTAAASKVTGETTLRKVDIRIPRSLPPDLPALEVVEVGGGRPAAAPFRPGGKAMKTGVEADAAARIALDVGVTAPPRRVKVAGQGFDGEFGGKLTVRGTAAAPDIVGRFTMQRGSLSVLGRDFRFTRGVLTFDGGPEIDPRLDVTAETKAGGDTARIKVQGSPRRPEISFESANGLPSDQVISQILFGKTTDRLTPGQAVELASALASLSGFEGPSSLLGDVRRKLGLDRLDVGTGADGKVTVEAGRNVADGVFVGVKQTADGPKGRVEVELTDTIRIEAGVGSGGAPEIGVGFELDY